VPSGEIDTMVIPRLVPVPLNQTPAAQRPDQGERLQRLVAVADGHSSDATSVTTHAKSANLARGGRAKPIRGTPAAGGRSQRILQELGRPRLKPSTASTNAAATLVAALPTTNTRLSRRQPRGTRGSCVAGSAITKSSPRPAPAHAAVNIPVRTSRRARTRWLVAARRSACPDTERSERRDEVHRRRSSREPADVGGRQGPRGRDPESEPRPDVRLRDDQRLVMPTGRPSDEFSEPVVTGTTGSHRLAAPWFCRPPSLLWHVWLVGQPGQVAERVRFHRHRDASEEIDHHIPVTTRRLHSLRRSARARTLTRAAEPFAHDGHQNAAAVAGSMQIAYPNIRVLETRHLGDAEPGFAIEC